MNFKKFSCKMASVLSSFALAFIMLADEGICFFIFHQPQYPEECRNIRKKK